MPGCSWTAALLPRGGERIWAPASSDQTSNQRCAFNPCSSPCFQSIEEFSFLSFLGFFRQMNMFGGFLLCGLGFCALRSPLDQTSFQDIAVSVSSPTLFFLVVTGSRGLLLYFFGSFRREQGNISRWMVIQLPTEKDNRDNCLSPQNGYSNSSKN